MPVNEYVETLHNDDVVRMYNEDGTPVAFRDIADTPFYVWNKRQSLLREIRNNRVITGSMLKWENENTPHLTLETISVEPEMVDILLGREKRSSQYFVNDRGEIEKFALLEELEGVREKRIHEANRLANEKGVLGIDVDSVELRNAEIKAKIKALLPQLASERKAALVRQLSPKSRQIGTVLTLADTSAIDEFRGTRTEHTRRKRIQHVTVDPVLPKAASEYYFHNNYVFHLGHPWEGALAGPFETAEKAQEEIKVLELAPKPLGEILESVEGEQL